MHLLKLNEHGDISGRQDREKEAKRQEDIARQNEESQSILNQFLAQLTPGSAEFNQLQTEGGLLLSQTSQAGSQQDLIRELGSRLVSEQQARAASGEAITAVEARTDLAFGGLREAAEFTSEEQALFNALRGIEGGGDGGGVEDIFSQLVSRAQDPDAAFDSTFQEQLSLAEEANRASFAQRGLLRSGLEQEGQTRAGNELAIREAQAREQFRSTTLSDFFSLFNAGQNLRGREIGLEEALVNLQQGRESNLTGLLQSQTGAANQNLIDLLSSQTGRSEDLRDLASALREAERQSREGFVGEAIGNVGGQVFGDVFPTTSPFPSTGAASPGQLQTAAQTGQTGGIQQSQASTLSRRRTQGSGDQLAQLIAALGGA